MGTSKVPTGKIVCLLELQQRCPPSELAKFKQFMAKREKYIARLRKLEESGARGQLPPIDWEFYKRNVRSEAVSLVEEFEKKYTSLTVPYPEDIYTAKLEKVKEKLKRNVQEFVDESNGRIEGYQKEMDRISNLLPFNQMTWEDYIVAYPEDAPDFIKNPTFWPHDPTEQIGYVDEEQVVDNSESPLGSTGECKEKENANKKSTEGNKNERKT